MRKASARRLDRTFHIKSLAPEAVVASEARKGYDFLMIGVESTAAARGTFHEQIARMAAGYDGPLAVAVARGSHLLKPPERHLNILVPVRGNKVSQRGAEVALALARVGTSAVTALYVMGAVGLGAAQRRLRGPSMTRRRENPFSRISSSWRTAMTRRSERPCVLIWHPRMPSCGRRTSGVMIWS